MSIHRQLSEVNSALSHGYETGSPLTVIFDDPVKPELLVTSFSPPRVAQLEDFNPTREGEFPIRGLLWASDGDNVVREVYCVVAEDDKSSLYGYEINQTIYNGIVAAAAKLRSNG